jgi:hypothetical protein
VAPSATQKAETHMHINTCIPDFVSLLNGGIPVVYAHTKSSCQILNFDMNIQKAQLGYSAKMETREKCLMVNRRQDKMYAKPHAAPLPCETGQIHVSTDLIVIHNQSIINM